MSILLKNQIINERDKERIKIEPYNPNNMGPNSYDVKLSPTLKVYNFSNRDYLDCKEQNSVDIIEIPEDGYILEPGVLYLGSTVEKVGSSHYIPMYEGRSSMARLGIQSHLSAGFGDIGFASNWTLEITVVHRTKVYANMRIGQVYFHAIDGASNFEACRYNGKYSTQVLPQESLSHIDFM
jgi:deoxycytidine triphosphate deaminase